MCLLAPVASALPRVQRAAPAERPSGSAGLVEAPVTVAQQGTGDLGEVQVEVRQHEQLVPEDMTAVRLAVQSSGRYADVEVRRVRG